jgi:hypothetical protein
MTAKLHLEAEIGDIASMGDVCNLLADHFADQLTAISQMNLTGAQATEQAQQSCEPLIFAVGHLSFMANQLKSRYLAEPESKEGAET